MCQRGAELVEPEEAVMVEMSGMGVQEPKREVRCPHIQVEIGRQTSGVGMRGMAREQVA